jgi:RNA polymerase primary sigma factor
VTTRALTREEEQVLFQRFNYCRYRLMRVLRRFRGSRLTLAAARETLRWDELAREARDAIVEANLGLVPTMIERSRITGVDFNELISEGHLALLRAVSKFDVSRGFKFSTYACRAILSSISRSVALSVRHRSVFPTEFDPDLQKSDDLERRRDVVESDCAEALNAILARNLALLTPAEKRVLHERFGVVFADRRARPVPAKTLREVADLFGLTKERVRQIQNKALDKLRTVLDDRVFATG